VNYRNAYKELIIYFFTKVRDILFCDKVDTQAAEAPSISFISAMSSARRIPSIIVTQDDMISGEIVETK
jgi:hypothetical protein